MIENLQIWWKKKPRQPRGFTLVELIISMLVFTIFIGVVSTVYISVTRSLRHASEVRKVYAEARFLMDKITQDVRLYTVDYECLEGSGTAWETTNLECSGGYDVYTGLGQFLPLISADGMHRVIYEYEDESFSILELDYDGADWVTADGYYSGFEEFVSDSVALSDIHFSIWPLSSPYEAIINTYQPSVHVVIEASSTSAFLPTQLTVTLQSTISSRVYGVSF